MSDRIVLRNMVFQGTHGVLEQEQREPQPFEVDVELLLNLQPAGVEDDLEQTVDYSVVFEACRQIVESTRFRLVEALAEAIAPPANPRRAARSERQHERLANQTLVTEW